jgi:GT2 family glycosyltransferase
VSAPRVAALVLNYNGREVTLQALASLRAMTYPAFTVFHIDNGSTDGSYEAVAAARPEIVQVKVEENRGVVFGMNQGMRVALDAGYDYLLLLNNDIEVEPDMLDRLVEVAESDPAIGCVGPKIYYHSERSILWSAGGHLRFRESITKERGMKERDEGQYDRDEEVPYVNGCATLIKRSVIEEVGLWDPLFHLALDDADWCMRMKLAGYKCFYAHRAVLYHMVALTVGGYTPGRTFHNGRSAALFVRRYGNFGNWLTFLGASALAIPAAFLRELPRGNQGAALAKLRGIVDGLRTEMKPPPMA